MDKRLAGDWLQIKSNLAGAVIISGSESERNDLNINK